MKLPPEGTKINLDDVVQILNAEIQWCYRNIKGYGVTEDYHMGFIKGLEQAKYLAIKLANEIEVDDE